MIAMEFGVSRQGAAVVSCQLCLVWGALCALVGIATGYGGIAALVFLFGSVLLLTLGTVHFAACRVRCGEHHLTVRHGVLFLSTRRLPLRYITGCHIVRSPLSRACGVCTLVLMSAGCISLLCGVRFADAQKLSAHLTYERGNI